MESSLAMLDSPAAFEDFKTTLAYFKAIIKWAVVTSHNNILNHRSICEIERVSIVYLIVTNSCMQCLINALNEA